MAKVLEGPGMGLMKKWGITVPNYVVVSAVDELTKLGDANDWLKTSKLVVKAHEHFGIDLFVTGSQKLLSHRESNLLREANPLSPRKHYPS